MANSVIHPQAPSVSNCIILFVFAAASLITPSLVNGQGYDVVAPETYSANWKSELKLSRRLRFEEMALQNIVEPNCRTEEVMSTVGNALKYVPSGIPTSTRDAARGVAISAAGAKLAEKDPDTAAVFSLTNRVFSTFRNSANAVVSYLTLGASAIAKQGEFINGRACRDPPRTDWLLPFRFQSFTLNNMKWFGETRRANVPDVVRDYFNAWSNYNLSNISSVVINERLQGAVLFGGQSPAGGPSSSSAAFQRFTLERLLTAQDNYANALNVFSSDLMSFLEAEGLTDVRPSAELQGNIQTYFSGSYDDGIIDEMMEIGLSEQEALSVIAGIISESSIDENVTLGDFIGLINQQVSGTAPGTILDALANRGCPIDC